MAEGAVPQSGRVRARWRMPLCAAVSAAAVLALALLPCHAGASVAGAVTIEELARNSAHVVVASRRCPRAPMGVPEFTRA